MKTIIDIVAYLDGRGILPAFKANFQRNPANHAAILALGYGGAVAACILENKPGFLEAAFDWSETDQGADYWQAEAYAYAQWYITDEGKEEA